MIKCKNCGLDFDSKTDSKKYCSSACYKKTKHQRYLFKHGNKIQITCKQCGKVCEKYRGQKFCSIRCSADSRKKYHSIPDCLASADRKIDKNLGYVRVYCPQHPFANTWGYVYEHRILVEQRLGRLLQKDEHVHHRNGIRWDNRDDNLQVLSPSEHAKVASQNDFTESDLLFGVGSPPVKLKKHSKPCLKCGKEFLPKRQSQKYCCGECAKKCTNWPTPEELEKLAWQIPTTEIAARLGVSDKAVDKHMKKLGLSKPGRGYWSKHE